MRPTISTSQPFTEKQSTSSSKPKIYGVLFFETFPEARLAENAINQACFKVDQLNIVVKAEGDMDDKKILSINPKVKLYAGAAWWTIHERRVAEGWYGSDKI